MGIFAYIHNEVVIQRHIYFVVLSVVLHVQLVLIPEMEVCPFRLIKHKPAHFHSTERDIDTMFLIAPSHGEII